MEEELKKVRKEIDDILEEEKKLNQRMDRLMAIEIKIKHAIFTSGTEDFEKQWGISASKVRKDFIQLFRENSTSEIQDQLFYHVEIANIDKIGGIIQHYIFEISPKNMKKCKLDKKTERAFELLKYILTTPPLLITKNPVRVNEFDYEIDPNEYKFHLENQ